MIDKNPQRSTKFAIRSFKVYEISCKECEEENFSYQIQYTTDEFLNVLVEFNRIYVNNDPSEFK